MATKKTDKQDSSEEVVMESTASQIIDTGFVAKKQAEAKEEPAEQKEGKIKSLKKRSVDILLIEILAAIIICAMFAFLGYNELASINKNHYQLQEQVAEESAQKVASIISQKASLFQQKFNSLQIGNMKNGEVKNSEELFPGSRVVFFSWPLNHNAIVDNPTQGYIFLDMLNQLYKKKTASVSPLELNKPNTKYASIVLAKKLINKDKNITGLYVLKVPTTFTKQLVEKVNLFNGSVLLTQGKTSAIQLASAGAVINNPISNIQAINNTRWRINYSHDFDSTSIALSSYYLLAIYAVLSLLSLLAALFFLIKYLNKFMEKKRKEKQIKNMQSENMGHSVLKNKQSISQLGMKKSEAVIDKIATKEKQTNKKADVNQADGVIDDSMITDYGIRGKFGQEINTKSFTHIAHAIAQEMENCDLTELCIGYDGRTSSEELYQAVLEGLKPYDIKVFDLGLVTLPVAYYVAQTKTNGNALMVTAGSSTAEYNGLKILLNNEIYTKHQLESLLNIVPEEGPELLQLEKNESNHLYINHITEKFNFHKKLKVVVDYANGVSSQIITDLLKMLGCNVIPIFEELNGNFPNHAPHPGKPENLQQLAEKVKAESADIGLAFNSDGTALGVVASNGDIIWNDRILMLLAKDLLQQKTGAKIMYDVKSTSSLHDWIIQYQGEPEITPSGCGNIKQRMDANHALLAGEFSGHIFFAEHANGLDDAFYTAAKLLQIISAYDGSSASLFKELPEKICTPEVLIAVQPGQEAEIMAKIISQKAEFQPAGIITLDGLRVEYEDGWGLVRQSRTTSSLSLRFEADTPQVLQRIAEKFKEVVLSVVFVKFPY